MRLTFWTFRLSNQETQLFFLTRQCISTFPIIHTRQNSKPYLDFEANGMRTLLARPALANDPSPVEGLRPHEEAPVGAAPYLAGEEEQNQAQFLSHLGLLHQTTAGIVFVPKNEFSLSLKLDTASSGGNKHHWCRAQIKLWKLVLPVYANKAACIIWSVIVYCRQSYGDFEPDICLHLEYLYI